MCKCAFWEPNKIISTFIMTKRVFMCPLKKLKYLKLTTQEPKHLLKHLLWSQKFPLRSHNMPKFPIRGQMVKCHLESQNKQIRTVCAFSFLFFHPFKKSLSHCLGFTKLPQSSYCRRICFLIVSPKGRTSCSLLFPITRVKDELL